MWFSLRLTIAALTMEIIDSVEVIKKFSQMLDEVKARVEAMTFEHKEKAKAFLDIFLEIFFVFSTHCALSVRVSGSVNLPLNFVR